MQWSQCSKFAIGEKAYNLRHSENKLCILFHGQIITKSSPRMLLSSATCTYSGQFFNARHNNWINKLSESQINTYFSRKRNGSCQSNGLMREVYQDDLTARDGKTDSCQMAKEINGTLASVLSLQFSFVNRSKQLIYRTRYFTRVFFFFFFFFYL